MNVLLDGYRVSGYGLGDSKSVAEKLPDTVSVVFQDSLQ